MRIYTLPPQKRQKKSIRHASPRAQWSGTGCVPCEGRPGAQLGLVLRKLAVSLVCCVCDGIREPSLPEKLSV